MFHLDSWQQTLPILLVGIAGVFLVIGIIVLITAFLNRITTPKK